MMEKKPVVWVAPPDEDDPDDFDRSLTVEVGGDWLAVDADQLVMPVVVTARDGEEVEEPFEALLKQYGGEGLLNEMLMDETVLERGSTWVIGYQEGRGRYVYPADPD